MLHGATVPLTFGCNPKFKILKFLTPSFKLLRYLTPQVYNKSNLKPLFITPLFQTQAYNYQTTHIRELNSHIYNTPLLQSSKLMTTQKW